MPSTPFGQCVIQMRLQPHLFCFTRADGPGPTQAVDRRSRGLCVMPSRLALVLQACDALNAQLFLVAIKLPNEIPCNVSGLNCRNA